ncbi:Beta-glucuronidase [termite gut metagenome]|uniref:beta-galactosidase n=1 Tax=termite gut metagenome TaxID=433724 RepID=A0A5J4T0V0_9ZZZZ
MSNKFIACLLLVVFLLTGTVNAQQPKVYKQDFSSSFALQTVGRGDNKVKNGVLVSKDAYAVFGNPELADYSVEFKARTPKDEEQVQIWAGFRACNRFDRYVFGMKGGLSDELYLSRMGYMGGDEFLALRPLDFHPEPGNWYRFKIEVSGNRIRVFLNDESLPRIDVTDQNTAQAPRGEVTLGGSWIPTEFDDLVITPLQAGFLAETAVKEYTFGLSPREKASKRQKERSLYQPVVVAPLTQSRTQISLNGNWLFMPEYQLSDAGKAVDVNTGDADWHVMNVPDFWNPIRIWLHGETFGEHRKGVSDRYYQKETDRCSNYTFDFKQTKAAWYRQWIELPANCADKHIELTFDAVSKVAEVYINGQLAGSHIGMFGDFKVDGTKLFQPGKNVVVVKVTRDFVKNIGDADKVVSVAVTIPVTNKMLNDIAHGFYQDDPAGIWQPVNLLISDPVKIEDVYIKSLLTGADFEVTVKNHSAKKSVFDVCTEIIEDDTKNLFYSENSVKKVELKAGEERVITFSIRGLKPRLWTPTHPNLYHFNFTLQTDKQTEIDRLHVLSGFRTFEVKNGLFELNGVPYWLRGGNHTPFALAPNDLTLANSFFQLMKAGNIDVTRTHTTPYNELWITAADRNGIGISHEGTWPWLMIHQSMPAEELIKLWENEYLSLLKKYRNHPSILFWTVNNEMKFYDLEPDFETMKKKFRMISEVVKKMRKIDPTRPVSFDSNYRRNEEKFQDDFLTTVDDGDIDDIHGYYNWYDNSFFQFFNGEFQSFKNLGRPLISQEMSTGYPNSETGHPTRFYNLVHQNPQTLIGYQSYEFANPNAFLKVQSFITGELAEALRRSNEQASGILHFALLTWFRNVYDAQLIDPYPTYYVLKRALQPVLVSAELWGRHFYAGERLPIQIYVVNDRENGNDLQPTVLHWEIDTETGEKLGSGIETIPTVKHYTRGIIQPEIRLPSHFVGKINAKFKLRLVENGVPVSENEYDIVLAQKNWAQVPATGKKVVLIDFDHTGEVLDFLQVDYLRESFQSLKTSKPVIFSGLDTHCTDVEIQQIRNFIDKGGKALFLNSKETVQKIFPEYISGSITPTEGDIVNMEIPESPVFNDLGLLELRYFNNNKREIPVVCYAAFQVNRNEHVIELANQTKIHAYIDGNPDARREYIQNIKGFPLLEINDKGLALISSMATDKATTDPIAGKLLTNMIHYLAKD